MSAPVPPVPPFSPGMELAGWSVAAVQYERRRVRVRLRRGPAQVGFSIHPEAGNPRPGPFDAAGFRIYTEATNLPLSAIAAPGRELATRLGGAGDALQALRGWARRGQGGETFDLGENAQEALEDLEIFVAEGGSGARVRGPMARVAETASRLVPLAAKVRIEPVLEGEIDSSELAKHLSTLADAGLRVQPVVVPVASSVPGLTNLVVQLGIPLRDANGLPRASPVDALSVQLPGMNDYAQRRMEPPRLSDVSRALAEAQEKGARRIRFSSRLGEPLCLSPGALRRAIIPSKEQSPGTPDPTFGAACEKCALRSKCGGVSREYALKTGTSELVPFRTEGPEPAWAEKARWLLVGRTGESVTLSQLMKPEEIPSWPCHLPWTRLELGDGGPVGPCCMEYQQRPAPEVVPLGKAKSSDFGIRDQAETPEELWNGQRLRSFRRAMTTDRVTDTCRPTCPVLVGGTYLPKDLILWGGPAASVEGQIRLVEDMCAGAEEVRSPPQSLCVATTSYCNYNCVMCDFGERGTLADEKPDRFWSGLEHWLGHLQQIDANGGEPLASPAFRAFLERAAFRDHPQLGISLTTNLSYLTPRQLEKFAEVPLASLTISVNAATPDTYVGVMRGLPMERWRENMDAVLRRRAESPAALGLTYSFVILKKNVSEIREFYELVKKDGVNARYMLPMRDLNEQSIMTSREHMEEARRALEDVAEDMGRRGREFEKSLVRANLKLLEQRLRDGIFTPL